VSGATLGRLLSACEAVPSETPANSATSRNVTVCDIRSTAPDSVRQNDFIDFYEISLNVFIVSEKVSFVNSEIFVN
jgi:hypothetical protein